MICEVGIRWTAFGSVFWKSAFNCLDAAVVLFCAITVLVIFFEGCSGKSEEVLDDILLVIRNAIQFGRLALVLRRCAVIPVLCTDTECSIDLANRYLDTAFKQ